MSVADKLLQIDQVKQDIKTAIETKGIPMTDVAFTEYANKISDISGGGGGSSLLFTDDLEQAQKAKEVFAMSDKVNNLNNVWEDYKRTPKLKYDLNLTYVTNLMGYFNVYSGDAVLTQLYDDCVNGVIQVGELYTIDNQIFPKVAYMYQGDMSESFDWPAPLYVLGFFSETVPQLEAVFNSVIFLSDLTSFDIGVGISLLALSMDLKFTNIKIFKQYENYEQGLIADLSEVTVFPAIQHADFPLCIVDNVEEIGDLAFCEWTTNTYPLVIPNSVTSIGDWAFCEWTANTYPLVIPNSVTSIGDSAFRGWSLVPYVEIQAITPPTLGSSYAFEEQNNAPIYVPDDSVAAYKAAANWSMLASRIFAVSEKP